MIEIHDVTKRYGPTVAVDRLSFEVREGEVTGFLGPNGAGESTTMRMMVGLDAPTSGRVTIDGRPYGDLRFPLRHVGALLEARAIHPGRSARSHLRWLADSNGIDRRRVDEVLDQVGLTDVANRRSGGSPSGWASASASPPPCSATLAPCSSTNRSTVSTPKASSGSVSSSGHSPPRGGRCWSRATS